MPKDNDRPVIYSKWLLFLKKNIQGFILAIPNNGSEGVCVFVYVCTRVWERWDECVCGKQLFGVGYYSLAILNKLVSTS